MRQRYFWPVSVGHASTGRTTRSCSRSPRLASTARGDVPREFRGTLVSDGYEAYVRYAAKLAKALKYALDREAGLSVHLSDADVPV